MAEVEVQKLTGYVCRVYDDSYVLKLWDAKDESWTRREFDKAPMDQVGIKHLGQPVEVRILEEDGRTRMEMRALGAAPGGPFKFVNHELNYEDIKDFDQNT